LDPRKGVVAIKSNPQSEAILGTGFFVSTGVILTCAHVIESYYHPEMTAYFRLEGSADVLGAELEYYSPKNEFDVAVLKPKRKFDFTPLRVVSSQNSKLHEFSIFGYPTLGDIHGLNGAGRILGWIQSPTGHPQLQLESRQVTQGFSGAPIWDVELESVIGMLQSGIKAEDVGRPSFGLPMEVLKDIYPELPLEKAGAAKSAQPAAKASAGDGGIAVNVDGDVSGNLIIGNNNRVGNSK
jgi:hypothetical protein